MLRAWTGCSSDPGRGSSASADSARLLSTAVPVRADLFAGRFELLEPIGEGGMAFVSKARDLRTGDVVARPRARWVRRTDSCRTRGHSDWLRVCGRSSQSGDGRSSAAASPDILFRHLTDDA